MAAGAEVDGDGETEFSTAEIEDAINQHATEIDGIESPKSRLTPQRQIEYNEFVDNALANNKKNTEPFVFFSPEAKTVEKVKREYGIDIAERISVLTDNDTRHIRNRHGRMTDRMADNRTGGYVILSDDIKAIPYILTEYDDVYYVKNADGTRDGLYYAVKGVDTTYYLEELFESSYLRGRQLIKTPNGVMPEIPGLKAAIRAKQNTQAFFDNVDKSNPEMYVQDVRQSVFINTIPKSEQDSNGNAEVNTKNLQLTGKVEHSTNDIADPLRDADAAEAFNLYERGVSYWEYQNYPDAKPSVTKHLRGMWDKSRQIEAVREAERLYADGEDPISYYERAYKDKTYNPMVASQLRGMLIRNGHQVGGALSEGELQQLTQYKENWKQLKNVRLSVTSPGRNFENLGMWRDNDIPSARAKNYEEGKRLRDYYFTFGQYQMAEKNKWMADEGEKVRQAFGNGGRRLVPCGELGERLRHERGRRADSVLGRISVRVRGVDASHGVLFISRRVVGAPGTARTQNAARKLLVRAV